MRPEHTLPIRAQRVDLRVDRCLATLAPCGTRSWYVARPMQGLVSNRKSGRIEILQHEVFTDPDVGGGGDGS
ncbi:MAG: hypothetical protein WCJ30_02885 [Deltaproteobacteria bacterium]